MAITIATIVKASPAEHFTATCSDILKELEFRLPEYTSSGTPLPSFVGTREKQLKMLVDFWTTAVWLLRQSIYEGWRESRTRVGKGSSGNRCVDFF